MRNEIDSHLAARFCGRTSVLIKKGQALVNSEGVFEVELEDGARIPPVRLALEAVSAQGVEKLLHCDVRRALWWMGQDGCSFLRKLFFL